MIIEPGSFYHVYNRGNNKEPIFLEKKNYDFFLKRMKFYFDSDKIHATIYCLMPNHYHLVIRPQHGIDLSNIMRAFTTSYVKSYNKWNNRVGHLFQGDSQAKLVESEEYLIHLCRYIHLNPVTAGLVAHPEDWVYSDYKLWISEDNATQVAAVTLRNELVGGGKEYQKFVMNYADAKRKQEEIERRFLSVIK
ncbi:MAG TPA: transposase [Bacteroidota bacterium]|nr:transposase [Bacteroidota bacterium]